MKCPQPIVPYIILCTFSIGFVGCSMPAPEEDEYGVVRLVFLPSEKKMGDFLYRDTSRLQVVLGYHQCVDEFYRSYPDMQQEGIAGAKVFEQWKGRLCTPRSAEDPTIQCEVDQFDQDMDVLGSTSRSQLVVDYLIQEQGFLDFAVSIGPLPTRDLTDCADGEVEVCVQDVYGFDDTGRQIWSSHEVLDAYVGMSFPLYIKPQRDPE